MKSRNDALYTRSLILSLIMLYMLAIAPASGSAADVVEASITVDSNYSVGLVSLDVLEGEPTESHNAQEGDYLSINVLSGSSSVIQTITYVPEFLVLTNPPMLMDSTKVVLRLPYRSNSRYLQISHNDTIKLEIDLKVALCNSDGNCNDFESHKTCPSDCGKFDEDGYCASVSYDGGCDPDCHPSLDIDCSCPNNKCDEYENPEICPDDCRSGVRDDYCDGLDDNKCDPDCMSYQDPDCVIESTVIPGGFGGIEWYWIAIIIAVSVMLLILFVRNRKGKAFDQELTMEVSS